MFESRLGRAAVGILVVALWSVILAACVPLPASEARLRITNNGTVPIEDLVVLFPDQEVVIGDVPAGATSAYVDVPKGVYAYGAYRFTLNGETVTQPVIDWVGEEPETAGSFTYTIAFDPERPAMQMIEFSGRTQDN
jgi:hypothetical protein